MFRPVLPWSFCLLVLRKSQEVWPRKKLKIEKKRFLKLSRPALLGKALTLTDKQAVSKHGNGQSRFALQQGSDHFPCAEHSYLKWTLEFVYLRGRNFFRCAPNGMRYGLKVSVCLTVVRLEKGSSGKNGQQATPLTQQDTCSLQTTWAATATAWNKNTTTTNNNNKNNSSEISSNNSNTNNLTDFAVFAFPCRRARTRAVELVACRPVQAGTPSDAVSSKRAMWARLKEERNLKIIIIEWPKTSKNIFFKFVFS